MPPIAQPTLTGTAVASADAFVRDRALRFFSRDWPDISDDVQTCLSLLMIAVLASGASQPSETERNKATVMRSEVELWSRGDLAVADQLYAPGFVGHFVVGPEWKGIDGIKNEVRGHRTSFPDWQETVDDIIAEGDRVVIRFHLTGTHRGTFAGIASTGRKVNIREVAIYRLAEGKIVEQWGMPDLHGLLTQLQTQAQPVAH